MDSVSWGLNHGELNHSMKLGVRGGGEGGEPGEKERVREKGIKRKSG